MSADDPEPQQVIVVLEDPTAVKNAGNGPGARARVVSEYPKPSSSKRIRGRAQRWEEILTVSSTDSFQNWLKEKESSGIRFTRKKASTTWKGAKEYYGCTGVGCPVQLEVLFDNSCDDVVISDNGQDHQHGERPHSGWGLPEKTKKKVLSIFRSGVSKAAEVDALLRRGGHTDYTMKQLVGFLNRVRRQSREQATVQEYSRLSVWSGRDRESPESSPPPADDCLEPDLPLPASAARQLSAATAPSSHSYDRRQRRDMDEETVRRLVDSCTAARRCAYSPYSQFSVGAALLCADGQIVTGCNVENASYGLTNCAERTAVFKAVSDGRRQFTAIAIAADMADKFVVPCGACRQVLAEFNAEMPVILTKPNGQTKTTSMKELLPMAFLPNNVPFMKE